MLVQFRSHGLPLTNTLNSRCRSKVTTGPEPATYSTSDSPTANCPAQGCLRRVTARGPSLIDVCSYARSRRDRPAPTISELPHCARRQLVAPASDCPPPGRALLLRRRRIADPFIAPLMGHFEGHSRNFPASHRSDQLMRVVAPNFPKRITFACHLVPGIPVRINGCSVTLDRDQATATLVMAELIGPKICGPGRYQLVRLDRRRWLTAES